MLIKNRFLRICLSSIRWIFDDTKTYLRTKIEIQRLEARIDQLERDLRSLES